MRLSFFYTDFLVGFGVKFFRFDVILHDVNKRTFDNLQNSLVEFQGLFNRNLYVKDFIFSLDKFIQCLKLAHIFFPKPFSDFSELCSDRSLLISVELLNLNIALVSKVFLDFVYCSVIDGLNSIPVKFRVALLIENYMSG